MKHNSDTAARKIVALHDSLGSKIGAALADPSVVEVMVNPDGRIWIDRLGSGMAATEDVLSPAEAESVIRLLADHAGVIVTASSPRVSATLPLTNERFQGEFPPLVKNACFAIRKPAVSVFTLDQYVENEIMSGAQAAYLREAIERHDNIVVIGGTGSGKTTLLNALLAEPVLLEDRIVLIEQTRELQCVAPNKVQLLTRDIEPIITMRDLSRDSLRLRPDRIVYGEVRGGEAYDMVKGWNTGHPGGMSTIHANSPVDALYRIEDLIGEVVERIPYRAIASAINLIVEIKRTPKGRRLTSMLRVTGYENGKYQFHFEGQEEVETNLLSKVKPGKTELRDVQNVVDHLCVPKAGFTESTQFFDTMAKTFLTSAILHHLYSAPDEEKHLVALRWKLADHIELLHSMLTTAHRYKADLTTADGLARDANGDPIPEAIPEILHTAKLFVRMAERLQSDITSTAFSYLSKFATPSPADLTPPEAWRGIQAIKQEENKARLEIEEPSQPNSLFALLADHDLLS